MFERSRGRFQAALRFALVALGVSGLAGCSSLVSFMPDVVVVYVDNDKPVRESTGQHHNGQPLIERMFIKRQATVNGQTITYYVDRSDPGKVYTETFRERYCMSNFDPCEDRRHFRTPEEPLRQQLLAIEAARPPSATESVAPSPPPPTPSVLPDPRITVPTLPPVPLPQL